MSERYLGEIRLFGGNYAPEGWALCDGRILDISNNEVLYTLLGTTYGGDGVSTFGLPDLRGRVPLHYSSTYPQGTLGGTESVTLTSNQMPVHNHPAVASGSPGNIDNPANAYWAAAPSNNYSDGSGQTLVSMSPSSLSPVGGSQPHNNMMPTLAITYIIATTGIFPSQN
ncbi:phage tail protein [Cohnella nanjingensis]|uniref:Phage tail protein n=1 Tax=Cohnella nanjingensis TaxID=1387779 RepID=A0A7X0VGC6_9BACL|nr:phage tail protein [Cohnella nanjingensis]